jgi:hypothetical protein
MAEFIMVLVVVELDPMGLWASETDVEIQRMVSRLSAEKQCLWTLVMETFLTEPFNYRCDDWVVLSNEYTEH